MELGAQNIQKWLGMTWDELVDWTQEERARRGQTVYRKLDPVEIEKLLEVARCIYVAPRASNRV